MNEHALQGQQWKL